MAPKKSSKPNGFVLFAQELQQQHGRKYASLKEAIDAAAPFWARMSKDQRKPYDDKAKQLKGQMQPSRYTSEGLNVDELTREEQLKNQMEETARQEIRNMITMAYRRGQDVLADETFFVIHCNIFCYYPPSDRYWPAEIAVLSFNLKDGYKAENMFDCLVNPGPLPIGYKFEAKQHSDETHLLQIPLDSEQKDNQEEIYFNLKAFLEKKKSPGTKRMPILFADKKYIKMIQRILNVWCEEFDTESELFRVYNLQVMFYFLRNTVAGEPVWSSITFSDRELEKDVYAYVANIACNFHSKTPKPLFCSRSIVLRYAYVICDNCCSDLNIELEPDHHVPSKSLVPDSTSTRGSTYSSRSSNFAGKSRRGFDSDLDTESNADTWDLESVTSNTSSTVTNVNLDDQLFSPGRSVDQFPSLGNSRSQNSDSSGFMQQGSSSVKSYAGATGRSTLPAAFERSIETMSISSVSSRGRGFGRQIKDSDSEAYSTVGASTSYFSASDNSDFPPIGRGRGRGFVPKNPKKPGIPKNN